MDLSALLRPNPAASSDPVDADELLVDFIGAAEASGISLYDAQEEALLELYAGANVILNTPTGSGKSLVALGAHVLALAEGRRAFYTAPIKALVSEKFFALCDDLGSENVGMLTGDAAVNASAPVICCTAEVLANLALREGPDADVGQVVMDEFHYYSDRDRGWAWQVPLLELPQAQFLLMSATLGETDFFVDELLARTGKPSVVVKTAERPVPLVYEYRETPIHETITDLLDADQAPVYIVHFTQASAVEAAGALMSLAVTTSEEKAAIKEAVGDFRFDSPVGKDLKRFILSGIGVHHAGLLPKYRLLTEKLAQMGLLKLICGTDTLGVGVNVPIRTVLFTQLCKYDGRSTRVLTVRDFQQIAGRAGRKGFDDVGHVWAQAPAHVVENKKLENKAQGDPKKLRKIKRQKPPERGYVHFDDQTFDRLINGKPEKLTSRFTVSHAMLLNMLDRPGDSCAAVRHRLFDNHDDRSRQRRHAREAISIYRSLRMAEVIEVLDEPDHLDRLVRVNLDLQQEFALNQRLSPFVVEALAVFDPETGVSPPPPVESSEAESTEAEIEIEGSADSPGERDPDMQVAAEAEPPTAQDPVPESEPEHTPHTYALDVLSLVESVLDDPRPVLYAQLDKLKGELIGEWKRSGVEYDERMARLEDVTWPKPLEDVLGAMFSVFAQAHPWVGYESLSPKSVARDMWERAMTFREYVNHYGLKRSEGVLLRYLTDAYKAMTQTVPDSSCTDEVDDLIEWLGAMVRSVDSSLIDEWERLQAGDPSSDEETAPPTEFDLTTTRGFEVMVRNEAFRWIMLLSRRYYSAMAEVPRSEGRWRTDEIEELFAPYWDDYDQVLIDAEARGPAHFDYDPTVGTVRQSVCDPDGNNEWVLEGRVNKDASREENTAVVELVDIRRL